MRPAIKVENLSKLYKIGALATAEYRTLRETVSDVAAWPYRRLRGVMTGELPEHMNGGSGNTELWALRDISFKVEQGEVIGVIGRNGAGKSTLLKVFSRITNPTGGKVELLGRVGSLLEVGTGFHPELTGRENIYLNGAILGMPRREIERKFDDIVAFSEVERFLDTPVKRYSSGMYTRLAFAVASHLEPEILIVDEVLAVGDQAFQKKCLGRMNEASREGRTVLFVSHNMMAIKSLCDRAILLDGGKVALDGKVDEVVDGYLSSDTDMACTGVIPEDAARIKDVHDEAMFRSVRMTNVDGKDTNQFYFGQPFRVGMVCDITRDIPDGHFEVSISTVDGTQVTYSTTLDGGVEPIYIPKGRHEIWVSIDAHLLPRQYTLDIGVHHHNGATADFVQRCFDFTIMRVAESGNDHYRWPRTRGLIRLPARWNLCGLSPHPNHQEGGQ